MKLSRLNWTDDSPLTDIIVDGKSAELCIFTMDARIPDLFGWFGTYEDIQEVCPNRGYGWVSAHPFYLVCAREGTAVKLSRARWDYVEYGQVYVEYVRMPAEPKWLIGIPDVFPLTISEKGWAIASIHPFYVVCGKYEAD